ncbi:MAG: flagellar basal body rod protein FlgB [Gammaproteobacteria bacterium]|jgi:flagellar basal-body rod protein FlgB
MPSLDQALGIHPQAMKLRAYRAQVLAANLANAETPNYRARDVDFRSALSDAGATTRLAATQRGHFSDATPGFGAIDLQYREPTQASLDQNTVDVAAERARFVDNSLRYQASLRFLDGKLSGIKSALRGE